MTQSDFYYNQMQTLPVIDEQPSLPGDPWPSHRFRAMGSEIALWLDDEEGDACVAFSRVERLFRRLEARLTRFDANSELSRLNARPERWVQVSPLLADVLGQALALAEKTGGLFDPTLLPALEAAGYTTSFERMGKKQQAVSGSPQPGRWPEVRLDPLRPAVWLPSEVRLDLGGIGKGYTAQLALDLLAAWGAALVDAGGDLVAGAPPRGLPGWPVAVAAPGGGDAPDLFHLWLAQAALATSGIDYRRWQQNGRPAHHLIDPRTGRPTTGDLVTATVLAPEATTAEGWGTASLIAGRERGLDLLLAREMAGALTTTGGKSLLTPAFAGHVVWPVL